MSLLPNFLAQNFAEFVVRKFREQNLFGFQCDLVVELFPSFVLLFFELCEKFLFIDGEQRLVTWTTKEPCGWIVMKISHQTIANKITSCDTSLVVVWTNTVQMSWKWCSRIAGIKTRKWYVWNIVSNARRQRSAHQIRWPSGHNRVSLRDASGKLHTTETWTNVNNWCVVSGSNHTWWFPWFSHETENKSTIGIFRKNEGCWWGGRNAAKWFVVLSKFLSQPTRFALSFGVLVATSSTDAENRPHSRNVPTFRYREHFFVNTDVHPSSVSIDANGEMKRIGPHRVAKSFHCVLQDWWRNRFVKFSMVDCLDQKPARKFQLYRSIQHFWCFAIFCENLIMFMRAVLTHRGEHVASVVLVPEWQNDFYRTWRRSGTIPSVRFVPQIAHISDALFSCNKICLVFP